MNLDIPKARGYDVIMRSRLVEKLIPFVGRLSPTDLRNFSLRLPWLEGVGVKSWDLKQVLILKQQDEMPAVTKTMLFSEEAKSRFAELAKGKKAFVIAFWGYAVFFWSHSDEAVEPTMTLAHSPIVSKRWAESDIEDS